MESNYEFNVSIDYRDYPKDKVYVVRYTDFPNVIGAGDTIEEAIEEAQGNLEVYFDYCKEEGIDPSFERTKSSLNSKEQKLRNALIKFFVQEMLLYTDTDGLKVIATYNVYVEDLKNKYPNAKPLSEEEYNLIKEAIEEIYGRK